MKLEEKFCKDALLNALMCKQVLMGLPGKSIAIFCSGSTVDISWRDVRVGQVLQVRDDELFPADLLCIYSALPDR